MPARPSVEKWNRPELEDQYHQLYIQNLELKKKNNSLENQLKRSNSRIRRAITERRDANNNPELQERNLVLERENRLLTQKLKALRHQLIVYTQPKAHNTTLEFLTSRSTARPRSTRVPQSPTGTQDHKIPLKSTENQKSSTAPSSRDKTRPQTHSQPRPSSASENSRPQVDRRPATSWGTRATEFTRTVHITPQPEESPQNVEDKTTIIRLHREVREKEEKIQELAFDLEKTDSKLTSLRFEYDRLVDEFEQARRKTAEQEVTIQNFKQEASRYNELSHKSLEVIEQELKIIQEENKVLKAANEKLVANSLQQEGISQSSIIELHDVQLHVQELERKLAELSSEKRRSEERVTELENERSKLSSKYKRLQEKFEKVQSQGLTEGRHEHVRDEIESPSPPPVKIRHVDRRHRPKVHETTSVLDELYEDVASIVDSHLSRTESSASLDALDRPNAKWRQMYEEVYSELEKVRNMLVIQHNINEKQQREINLLNSEAKHYKATYEKKLNELVTELENRAKHIEVLENQLRSIAGGDVSRVLPSERPADISLVGNEMILKLSKIILNEKGTKMSTSAKPMLFLSLEFFDFELQTTPLLQGPEATFDYSSVYDVIISNLFIHYIETDGITVELFEVKGVSYEQWGSGTISLKRLLDVNTPANISGKLQIHSISDHSTSIATLEYRLEVPFNLVKALNAQKRRITASTYLPIAEGEPDKNLYNELIIQIHRAGDLGSIFGARPNPSTYIAYQIYDLPPHLSNVLSSNPNPEFNDTRSWTLPVGMALHQYLKTEEFLLYVIEDSPNMARGMPSGSMRYGMVNLPLFPLARNQKLSGTFSLVGPNGDVSKASIDLSIYWKYAYKFQDDDLEVDMPIPVKRPPPKGVEPQEKPKDVQKPQESQKPSVTGPQEPSESRKPFHSEPKPPELPSKPVKVPSMASISSTEQESVIEVKKPPPKGVQHQEHLSESSEASEELVTVEKSTDSDLLRKLLNVPRPGENEPETEPEKTPLPKVEPGKDKAEQELERIEKEEDLRHVGEHQEERTLEEIRKIEHLEHVKTSEPSQAPPKPLERLQKQGSTDSNATYEISEDDLVPENLRGQIPKIDSKGQISSPSQNDEAEITPRPLEPANEEDLLPRNQEEPMPSPHSGSTSTESQLKELESLAEELNDTLKSEDEPRKPSVSEVLDDGLPVITPPPPDTNELKKLVFPGRLQPLQPLSGVSRPQPMPEQQDVDDKRPDLTKSLLGELPSLGQRPIPPPRTKPKAVEFTEPLHSSIPPSETSSYASSIAESVNSHREPRPRRFHPVEPENVDAVSAPTVLRTVETPTSLSDEEVETDCTVVLRIGQLAVVDDSPLLHRSYDGMHVFVEWKFLDYDQELCETPESLELPKSPRNPSRFETEKVYELNKRRLALLKQWVELGNRLDFTLVSDPGDDGECDDLGVAQLDLGDVIHSNGHILTFYDVDREPLATLEIEIYYSDALMRNFEFEEE